MYKPSSNSRQASLFWDLETMLDSKHPLFKLANMIDWALQERPSSGTELLQGSFRRLYKCHARCCRI